MESILSKSIDNKILLLDLYNQWSGHCIPVESYLQKASPGVEYVKLAMDDLDEFKELQNDCSPHLCLIKNKTVFYYATIPNTFEIEHAIEAVKNVEQPKKVENFNYIHQNSREDKAVISNEEQVVLVIKPDSLALESNIVEAIKSNKFQILERKKVWLQRQQVETMYTEHMKTAFFEDLYDYMTVGPVVLLKVSGKDPTAIKSIVNNIRATEERDKLHNVLYSSSSEKQVALDMTLFNLEPVEDLPNEKFPDDTVLVLWNTKNSDLKALNAYFKHLNISILKEQVKTLSETQLEYFMSKFDTISREELSFNLFEVRIYLLKSDKILNKLRESLAILNPSEYWKYPNTLVSKLCSTRDNNDLIIAYYSSTESCSSDKILLLDGTLSESKVSEKLLFFIKPGLETENKESILQILKTQGFEFLESKRVKLSAERVRQLYKKLEHLEFFDEMINWLTDEEITVYILEKDNGILDMKRILGPKDVFKAKEKFPDCVRAKFATSSQNWKNCAHSSDSDSAKFEISLFFGDKIISRNNSMKGGNSRSKLLI
eukprot:NODE_198_length_13236_cov_1.328385.p2 type:complete len:545 gc:universal NODE_198_length_13236_cov_1.328385:3847-5481(+)